MRSSLLRRAVPLSLVAVIAGAWLAHAGDLNPPAGPIAPTMKSLDEVEPRVAINATNTPGDADSLFKITQPGSYYLTGNITGVVGKRGIEIAVSNVTIDLMGFTLQGVGGSLDGIATSVIAGNLTIRNGGVSGFGQDGIDLSQDGAFFGSLVEQVHASNNTAIGIRVNSNAVVRACTATSNGTIGISAADNVVIESCAARQNQGGGISAGAAGTITNCSVRESLLNGISVGTAGTITNCSLQNNLGDGINAASGSTITNCSVSVSLEGIKVSSDCTVRGNTCTSNGAQGDGAGIHATGGDNRIEGNNCTDADRGIDVDGTGNLILRNSASGNTINYAIAVNNRYGVVVNITANGTPAVAGNSAASTLTTTDPWANFAY